MRAFAQENKEIAAYNSKIEHVLQLMQKEAAALGLFWGLVSIISCLHGHCKYMLNPRPLFVVKCNRSLIKMILYIVMITFFFFLLFF